jgi:hypothetical protein
MLRHFAGVYDAIVNQGTKFGYVPTKGSIEFEFIEYLGVCTDSVEYKKNYNSYCTKMNNAKVNESNRKKKKIDEALKQSLLALI